MIGLKPVCRTSFMAVTQPMPGRTSCTSRALLRWLLLCDRGQGGALLGGDLMAYRVNCSSEACSSTGPCAHDALRESAHGQVPSVALCGIARSARAMTALTSATSREEGTRARRTTKDDARPPSATGVAQRRPRCTPRALRPWTATCRADPLDTAPAGLIGPPQELTPGACACGGLVRPGTSGLAPLPSPKRGDPSGDAHVTDRRFAPVAAGCGTWWSASVVDRYDRPATTALSRLLDGMPRRVPGGYPMGTEMPKSSTFWEQLSETESTR